MSEMKKNKLEARKSLEDRENAIANAVATSLSVLRDSYVASQKRADKSAATAGQNGAWWIACLMVREKLTIDEAFTNAKKELKNSGVSVSKLELYRPLVPHALSVRNKQCSSSFNEKDDCCPKIKWLTVQQYRDHLTIADMTAGEAVGKWEAVIETVNEEAIQPFLVQVRADGGDPKRVSNEDKLRAVKTAANKIRKGKKSGNATSQTPEQVALSLLKKDETCLALLSLCGEGMLAQIERVIAQVRRNRNQASY